MVEEQARMTPPNSDRGVELAKPRVRVHDHDKTIKTRRSRALGNHSQET